MCGYAETIPLKNCSYDSYIISFGLRNVTKIDNVLNEAFRVLKKGGQIVICSNIWFNDASLLKDDVHFHHFRKSQIMSSLNKNFKVKKILNYEHPKKNVTNRFMMCLLAQKR